MHVSRSALLQPSKKLISLTYIHTYKNIYTYIFSISPFQMRDVSKDSAEIDSQQSCGTSGVYCIRMTFMIIKME